MAAAQVGFGKSTCDPLLTKKPFSEFLSEKTFVLKY